MSYNFRPDHDFGPLDAPHQVLLGADLSTTRHFDISNSPQTIVAPSGLRLASLATDRTVRVDDLTTGRHVAADIPGVGQQTPLRLLGWSPDATRVYAYVTEDLNDSWGSQGQVWEVDLNGAARAVPGASGVRQAVPAPDDRRLAVVRSDGTVEVIDRTTGAVIADVLGPSGLTIFARLVPEHVDRHPELATDLEAMGDARHAQVDVAWSPSGGSLVTLESQGAGLLLEGSERFWQGQIVRIIDMTSGARRTLHLAHYYCRPLAMLTETSMLCESSADTESGDSRSGMTTLDLLTGQRRVVARFPSIDNGVWWTYVAADLARTWRFSLSQPWMDPGPVRE